MKKNAQKNHVMFFGGAIVAAIAVFISSVALLGIPQAHAYAVGSVSTGTTVGVGAAGSNYDIGNSLQNLVSPFTGFINTLKSNTMVGLNGTTVSLPVNITPVVEGGVQNTVSQWFSDFGNWFYGVTGIQLSGITLAILNVLSWTLGLAQQVVNWLLGLFH